MSDPRETECGFCDGGTLTYRGKAQTCPYCGGTGKCAVIEFGFPNPPKQSPRQDPQSPPRQSPRERLSEIEDVSGGNALPDSDVSETFAGLTKGLEHCSSPYHCPCGCGAHMGCFIYEEGDYAAGVPLNDVDEAVIRRISEGERDRNGNLIWLRSNGDRR